MLNYQVSGEGRTVLLAHGLFGQARNLGGLARRLVEAGRRVISVDMRNHGDSFWDDDHSYEALARDLAEVIADQGGNCDVVGHSMGGKAAMMLALLHPEMIGRLVVLDIAPVDYGHSRETLIDAMDGLDLAHVTRRSEANRQLSGEIGEAGVRAFLLQSLDLKSEPPQWKLNLNVLRAQMDQITGWPKAAAGHRFDGPTLFLAGARSDYIRDAGRDAIRAGFPQAKIARIKDAGHWLHADQPQAVGDAVAAFLTAAQASS